MNKSRIRKIEVFETRDFPQIEFRESRIISFPKIPKIFSRYILPPVSHSMHLLRSHLIKRFEESSEHHCTVMSTCVILIK